MLDYVTALWLFFVHDLGAAATWKHLSAALNLGLLKSDILRHLGPRNCGFKPFMD